MISQFSEQLDKNKAIKIKRLSSMYRFFELFYLFIIYQESAQCGSSNNGCQHKCTNGVCSCNAGYNLVGNKQCVAKDCGTMTLTYCASGL